MTRFYGSEKNSSKTKKEKLKKYRFKNFVCASNVQHHSIHIILCSIENMNQNELKSKKPKSILYPALHVYSSATKLSRVIVKCMICTTKKVKLKPNRRTNTNLIKVAK